MASRPPRQQNHRSRRHHVPVSQARPEKLLVVAEDTW